VAKKLQIPLSETALNIDEIVDGIRSGDVSEAMACGTAATIAGIRAFRFEDGETITVAKGTPGPVTERLFRILQGIQFGHDTDPFGWIRTVPEQV
jgi:branched-chain amino acid aminotransferase